MKTNTFKCAECGYKFHVNPMGNCGWCPKCGWYVDLIKDRRVPYELALSLGIIVGVIIIRFWF